MPAESELQTGFSFFYMRRGKAAQSEIKQLEAAEGDVAKGGTKGSTSKPSYFDSVKHIATINTVEQFWSLYDHLIRPSSVPPTTDLHLFRSGIQPTWEDPSNARGGKWLIRLKKGLASRYWEELVLALIGGQFSQVACDEICGIVVSIRYNEDIVSVWNRNASNADVTERVRDMIKRILSLPNHAFMEYKPHVDSLADKSSFRNTQVWRQGGSGSGGGEGGGPPRRMGSRGEGVGREEGKGKRSEVERAWR